MSRSPEGHTLCRHSGIWNLLVVGLEQFVQIDQHRGRRRFPGQRMNGHGFCVARLRGCVNTESSEGQQCGDWLTQ